MCWRVCVKNASQEHQIAVECFVLGFFFFARRRVYYFFFAEEELICLTHAPSHLNVLRGAPIVRTPTVAARARTERGTNLKKKISK